MACRQLGYSGAVSAYSSAVFGQGSSPRVANVICSLNQCRLSPPTCAASASAGVRCDTVSGASPGDIRLANSRMAWVGRVEVFHSGTWGTVCDDYWDMNEAVVICRQLGFPGATAVYSQAAFGRGKGRIWLDDVKCTGNETRLDTCPSRGWGSHNCGHSEDGGVACVAPHNNSVTSGSCNFDSHSMCGYRNENDDDFDWSLHRGRTGSYGTGPYGDHTQQGRGYYIYIETSSPRQQGELARVISPTISSANCVQFYYSMGGSGIGELSVYLDRDSQPRTKIWQLSGRQSRQWRKAQFPVTKTGAFRIVFEGMRGASYSGDIALDGISVLNNTCSILPSNAKPKVVDITNITHSVRLVGMNVSYMGRVEILHKGRWGTVCGTHFHLKAANVVCRQLGYQGAAVILPCCTTFSAGQGMIWLDQVHCEGREAALSKCPHPGWGRTSCYHSQDAGVLCKTNNVTLRGVRLAGSGNSWEGRVEVKINGIWGVINDAQWDIYDANVVCKQLGFNGASGVYTRAHYGSGPRHEWLSNVRCNGNENSLWNCNMTELSYTSYSSYWSSRRRNAGTVCYKLRLTGGKDQSEGRVEVQYNGVWGTICNIEWDVKDADVVCRQLGYPGAKAILSTSPVGATKGTVPLLTRVKCHGNEPGLGFCAYQDLSGVKHLCTHKIDAQAACNKIVPTTFPRTQRTTLTVTTVPTAKPANPTKHDAKPTKNVRTTPPTTQQTTTRTNKIVRTTPPTTKQTTTRTNKIVCPNCPNRKDSCYITQDGGVCVCPEQTSKHYKCDATVGKDVTEVSLLTNISKWNASKFKTSLANQLNNFCSKALACGFKDNRSHSFSANDVVFLRNFPQSFQGKLNLRLIILIHSINGTLVFSRQTTDKVISQHHTLAGYVIKVDTEPNSSKRKKEDSTFDKSKLKIIIPVIIVLLIAVGMAVAVVIRLRRRRQTSNDASQSYRRLLEYDVNDPQQDDPPIEI